MDKAITIQELLEKTVEVQELFRKLEKRPWTIDTFLMELTAEVGTLADSIVIREGYRQLRKGQEPVDLEDDISDILFILFMIANHYGIDIGKSYLSMINKTREILKLKINKKEQWKSE